MAKIDNYKRLGRSYTRKLYPIKKDDVCYKCGSNKKISHHHIDGNPQNSNPENISIICHICHLRYHRQNGHVGKKSKLSQTDLNRIIDKSTPISQLAKELGFTMGYLRDIRNGRHIPIPIEKQTILCFIPPKWKYIDMRGKPRALTISEVHKIRKPQPVLGRKKAEMLAKEFNVNISTIYKARMGHGCYAQTEYDI